MEIKNWRDLEASLSFSKRKLRPEISEPAKTVRKRIFYIGSISFLLILANTQELEIFGFNVPYKNALLFMFIGMIYSVAHFIHELYRDFNDGRAQWKGETSGLLGAKEYVELQIQLLSITNSAINCYTSAAEEINSLSSPELDNIIKKVMQIEKDIYKQFNITANEIHNDCLSIKCNALESLNNNISAFLHELLDTQQIQNDIQSAIGRIEGEIASKFSEIEFASDLNTSIHQLKEYALTKERGKDQLCTVLNTFTKFKKNSDDFFLFQKKLIVRHKWRFIGFIVSQWIFEVVAPLIFSFYILVGLAGKYSHYGFIIYDIFSLLFFQLRT